MEYKEKTPTQPIFSWEQTPPAGIHPGKGHNCRCYAQPLPKNIIVLNETKNMIDDRYCSLGLDMFGFEIANAIERLASK